MRGLPKQMLLNSHYNFRSREGIGRRRSSLAIEHHADKCHLVARSVDIMQADGAELYQIEHRPHESFFVERCLVLPPCRSLWDEFASGMDLI